MSFPALCDGQAQTDVEQVQIDARGFRFLQNLPCISDSH